MIPDLRSSIDCLHSPVWKSNATSTAAAPHVDLTLAAYCPECDREFTVPFDLPAFFLAECQTSRDLLDREVHYLAYHYHWSEHDILALSREKRRKYIAILAEELRRVSHAV